MQKWEKLRCGRLIYLFINTYIYIRRRYGKFMQKRWYNHNIITKADKGGTIVTVDTDDYVQEATQQ